MVTSKETLMITITNKKLTKTFKRFNQKYFESKLNLPNEIIIEYMDTELGAYIPFDEDITTDELYLTYEFDTKRDFETTLLHEMVHIWQWQILKNEMCGHDTVFETWQTKFSELGWNI